MFAMEVVMRVVIGMIERFLVALGRTPGEEFSHGLYTYRLIEHPREEKGSHRIGPLGDEDEVLRRAS